MKQQSNQWPIWKITLALYPLGMGAVAVNIFFLGLMLQTIGITAFPPWVAIILGAIIGVPFTWLFARHIHKLIAKAEAEGD